MKTIEQEPSEYLAVVKVHFHDMPTMIWSRQEWEDVGGWKGFLKQTSQNIRDVERIEKTTMSKHDFANLKEWEP